MDNVTINAVSDSANMDSTAPSYANGSLVRGEKIIPGSTTCDTGDGTVFTATGATNTTSTTASSASTTAATTSSTTSGGGTISGGGGGGY